ncbi:MAG: VC_2705 family sodium/solute symporter, partial [Hydrogenophaga sp.]|nr:VC_2705 family sodium/solute symporter [Hydrogenophaga sp.]
MGYGGSVFLLGWTGGYVLLAMLLAPYLRKFGKFTVPEFIGDRFYSKSARNVAVLCLLIASLTYIIGQMTGVGVTFARFLGVTSDQGIYIGMAIVFAYAVFGGMKGITYTQVAQYCVLILAYLVPAFFISLNLTGNFLPQLGLGSAMAGTDVSLLTKLDQVVTDLGFGQYTTTTAGTTLNMFFYTVSLMIGTAGLPHVIVRFFTVPKVADARSSAGWALVFIALLYTTAPAVGAMAKLNLHGTVNSAVGLVNSAEGGIGVSADAVNANGDLYAPEASLVYEQRPDWMKRWEKTGLLKWEDKNGDGRIQYYNDATKNEVAKGKAQAAGWKGNELTVNADIIVLANP